MKTIASITIILSTALLASESPTADTDSMDSSDHRRIGDAAVEAVETKIAATIAATYPDVDFEVSWSRDAMARHHVEVSTTDGPCGPGDREVTDVRDIMLEALEAHLRAA